MIHLPALLIKIAWIIVCARSGYRVVSMLNSSFKPWFEVLFHAAVFVIALSFIFH